MVSVLNASSNIFYDFCFDRQIKLVHGFCVECTVMAWSQMRWVGWFSSGRVDGWVGGWFGGLLE